MKVGGTQIAALVAASATLLAACGDDGERQRPAPERDSGPPVYEWGEPAAAYAGAKPRGVIMLLHGGGWEQSTPAYEEQVGIAPIYQRRGYATLALGYGPGDEALEDVERFYRKARERYGKQTPICAIGASAGGHLALMLAAREPELACVIALAGPTDLTTLNEQGGGEAYGLAVRAFGRGRLERLSPVEYTDRIEAEVLLVFARRDPVVPVDQGEEMAAALEGAELIVLPPGPAPFIHGPGVDEAAKQQASLDQVAFLDRVTGSG